MASHLKQLTESMEAEIQQRTQDYENEKNKAIAASRAKTSFLSNMSHELRTPLNAIQGFAELILDEAEENEHDGYIADCKKISESTAYLISLISEVLDIAKIESGQKTLQEESIDVEEFFMGIVHQSLALAKKKENTFTWEKENLPETIYNDATRLQQVILNLVGNSAKFTKKGKIILRRL